MAKESSKEFSVFVLWEKESFSLRNSRSRNSSRGGQCLSLKGNQGSEAFVEFSGKFCTLWSGNYVFKSDFM